jgi:predicted phosphodiesterase
MMTAMSARLSRTLVLSFTTLLLPIATTACGSSPTDEDAAPAVVCEGVWQENSLDHVSDTTFTRGPYLQSVMANTAVVVWRDAPGGSEGCVHWSLPGEAEQTTCAAADERGQYEVRLDGLPHDTLVGYRASVGDRQTGELTFRSAPVDTRPIRLAVFADAHRNEETLDIIAAQSLLDGVDGVVSVGDQISQPEEDQFDQYFAGLRPLLHRVPLWPVIGNHEALGDAYFQSIVVPGAGVEWPELYYGVRFGNVWIGALDLLDIQLSAAFGKDIAEIAWLKSALESREARSARWRLLFIHEPPYSIGWGECDGYHGEQTLRNLLVPLAAEYNVAAIFSGHMHGYEHGKVEGVELFVSGGAGGGLDMSCETPEAFPSPWTAEYVHHSLVVDAGCDSLTVQARRLDGTTIETTTIQ